MKIHDTESPIRYSHPHYGTVYTDGSFTTTDGKHRTFGAMAGWRDRYRAADRMHQPLTLSFWTDVCNGKKANWPLPLPSDKDKLKELDAYGHLTWTVGYNDEWSQEGRGDWMACFDFVVWEHPSRGVLVAYEVIVNSDSGGFIDTLDRGVVTADKAPTDLPDYWASIGMDDGTPWTEAECRDSWKTNDSWNAALDEAIGDLAARVKGDRS